MSKLVFSDGIEFNFAGKLRVTRRSDGWYVVGEGMLIPVDSRQEGEQLIADDSKLAPKLTEEEKRELDQRRVLDDLWDPIP